MENQLNHLDQGCSQFTSGQNQSHLLTDREVSTMLGVSVATVRRWRLFRMGPKYIKIGFSVRYRPDDVTRWLDTRPIGGELQVEVAK